MQLWITTAIFVLTYLLIASRRFALLPIGRPAGALLGAVLMVASGALTPEEAYRSVDANTLVLLFGLMALSAYLERAGAFAIMSKLAIDTRASGTTLLFVLVFGAGLLSAFLLNDTVCLVLTPVVCEVCVRRNLPLGPYLLALATAANIGSAATLVGNPQNVLIGSLGPLDFLGFARLCAPAALVGLAIDFALLRLYFGKALVGTPDTKRTSASNPEPEPEPAPPLKRAPLYITALVILGYLAGIHLALATLAGVTALVVLDREEPTEVLARVDWTLLTFFAALFVVTHGFAQTGLPERAWAMLAPHLALERADGVAWFSGYTLVGSNLFSNVPLVMLSGPLLRGVAHAERGFALLGFVSTVAGNLTLLGSVANLIVAERAREHYELGFFEYLRFGLVSTAIVLIVGVPLVCWLS